MTLFTVSTTTMKLFSRKAFYLSLALGIPTGICQAQQTHYYILESNQPPSLIADAGEDFTFSKDEPAVLGGDPPASGGTGPYSYSWTPGENLSNSEGGNPVLITGDDDITYTLTVTDNMGCHATDKVTIFAAIITSVTSHQEIPFTVSPNPVQEWLTIRTGERQGTVTVLDSNGRPLWEEALKSGEHVLDVRNLSSGLYMLNIIIRRETYTVKLLVP